MNKTRLAVIVSHPIQHFVPYYRAIAADPAFDLCVFYCSRIGLESYFDHQMNSQIKWGMDMLGGYQSRFLDEAPQIVTTGFFALDNPSMHRALAELRPEAALLFGYGSMSQLRALAYCRLNRVPALLMGDSELKRRRPLAKRLVKEPVVRVLLHQFAAFLTAGHANEEYYESYGVGHERMFHAPFTIDEVLYRQARAERAERRASLRNRLGIKPEAFVVATIGKVTESKRTHDMVEAAKRIREQRGAASPIEFLIAGDGADRARMEKTAVELGLPVHFLGFVNVDGLPDVYCASDVLAHPSEKDAHPLVLSEAACIGLPIVVSDRVGAIGATDIVQPDRNGLVFPCGDVGALTSNLLRLSDDPILFARMAAESLAVFQTQCLEQSLGGLKSAVAFARR
jgi:glycosyltransferase involved in cell wall biosynthesis